MNKGCYKIKCAGKPKVAFVCVHNSGQSDEVFEETIRKIEENIICLKQKLSQ